MHSVDIDQNFLQSQKLSIPRSNQAKRESSEQLEVGYLKWFGHGLTYFVQ